MAMVALTIVITSAKLRSRVLLGLSTDSPEPTQELRLSNPVDHGYGKLYF